MSVDSQLALRAGLVQAAGVLVLGLATGLTLSEDFFESWGWIAGPLAWMLAAAVTARVLRLPAARTLLGAALAGLPSGLATLAGLHWLGAALAIVLFAAWCGAARTSELTGRTA